MTQHIKEDEFSKYFRLTYKDRSCDDEDGDFICEIEAHVAECGKCFQKMQKARLLMTELVSDREKARRFIGKWYPEVVYEPAFDIKKAFLGIKVVITEKMQALADTLSGTMDVVFVPDVGRPALARGDSKQIDGEAINDLLYSSMEYQMQNGRKVVLRCRKNKEGIFLFVYSNFEIDFILTPGEKSDEEIPLYKKEHDELIGEYIYTYKLDGESFNLTAR